MSLPIAAGASQTTLQASDIEIGAVELKDATTDTRAIVDANGVHVSVQSTPNNQSVNMTQINGSAVPVDVNGIPKVAIAGQSGGSALADATNNPTTTLSGGMLHGFNGSTWDRLRSGVTSLTSVLTGWLNVLPWAIYNASQSSRAEAQGGPLQVDSLGNLNVNSYTKSAGEDLTNDVLATTVKLLASATYSPSRFQNLGANVTLNVKSTSGNVFSFVCHNTTGVDRYFQLHNTATTPLAGATPVFTFLIPASSTLERGTNFFLPTGVNFSSGIAFAISTTETIYTAGAATDQMTHILFI